VVRGIAPILVKILQGPLHFVEHPRFKKKIVNFRKINQVKLHEKSWLTSVGKMKNTDIKIVKQSFSARLLDIVIQHSCIKLEKG